MMVKQLGYIPPPTSLICGNMVIVVVFFVAAVLFFQISFSLVKFFLWLVFFKN